MVKKITFLKIKIKNENQITILKVKYSVLALKIDMD